MSIPPAPRINSRQVWRLAWPTITAAVLTTCLGLIHFKIVAHLGSDALATVTAGQRLFFMLQALLMGLSVAVTTVVAQAWGAGNRERATGDSWQGLYLGGLIAVLILLAVIVFSDDIPIWFGLAGNTADLTSRFIVITTAFSIFFSLSLILPAALRAVGDARTPLRYAWGATAINIGLCWLLVNGHWGFPALGSLGIAWGTGLAPAIAFTLLLWHWYRGGLPLPSAPPPAINREAWKRLLKLGTPAAAEQVVLHTGLLLFLRLVADYGTDAYAAYGIGLSLLATVIVVGYGFSIAASTLAGQCAGAGRRDLAKLSAFKTLKLSGAILTVLALLFVANARALADFMTPNTDVAELTETFVTVLGLLMPLLTIELTLAGVLRGLGDTRFPLVATASGLGCRLLLGGVVLALEADIVWLFATLIADYALKALLISWRFAKQDWNPDPISARP